jgi:hypothetical protein
MAASEIAALRHDIERYISIANEHATEAEQLRPEASHDPRKGGHGRDRVFTMTSTPPWLSVNEW